MDTDYLEYFKNINDFKFKKTIIDEISKTYDVILTNEEYNRLIKLHISNRVIAKSTNSPGKCGYISQDFLDVHQLDPIMYYKSKKVESVNLVMLTKKTLVNENFIKDDCINQVNLEELFNEL